MRSNTMSDKDDCISRQAALDCFCDWFDRYGHEHTADEDPVYQSIAELPDVQPEPHWIPCSERLPEKADYYLVQAMMNGDIFVARWEVSYWNVKTPIIAWMPLPVRYKGDDTERTISDLCRNWDDLLERKEGQ